MSMTLARRVSSLTRSARLVLRGFATTRDLPSFPTDVPTHPLLVIDYARIKAGDKAEVDQLWKAATTLGFWYLKNHGVDAEADAMFKMGEDVMRLPLEEKMKFEQGDNGNSFGYKAAGANATNAAGVRDTVEFINVSKDDALSFPQITHRTYPSPTMAAMPTVVQPFVRKSVGVNGTLLSALSSRLGLPAGSIERRHTNDEHSASETRVIHSPPPTSEKEREARKAIGAHTDFGSLSFLHNRLGGLQVLVPGSDSWQYIKPIPGHAVCNLGDAMAIFSGGILRSNVHRVVPPPSTQAHLPRWSLVFFSRPGNGQVLRALTDESTMIRDAVEAKRARGEDVSGYDTGSTAFDWFARRIRNQRIKNRTGPETWLASRGTEGRPEDAIPDDVKA
ncbi:hypothetical protein BD626DRAFT_569149 [Schizophyllum amplum]|uniref:Fe2OG dioxygenase domain-containing protein n=1 Tax=Schizophyllum amplum TaxID=97359 RepID=A0A550CE65_9AGAR|nr:hypothetical protein BD626DRAFT_569149 [Auriculariopsis ampla]